MNFTANKKRKKASLITTIVLLTITIISVGNFFNGKIGLGVALLACAVALSLLAGVLIITDFNFKKVVHEKIFVGAVFFLAPVAIMTMTECLNYIFITKFDYVIFAGNYLFYLLIQAIFYVLTNRVRWSLVITASVMYAFGLANYAAITFRGSPFVPLDFLAIKTAFDVAGNYDIKLTYNLVLSTFMFICIILLSMKIKFVSKGIRQLMVKYTTAIVSIALIMGTFYTTDTFANLGIKADLWNQSRGYSKSGSAVNFWLNTRYLYISAPEQYSPEKAQTIVNTSSEVTSDIIIPNDEVKPNIIAVMNETFSDLNVLGDLQTNQDFMPFVRGLTENTIKGNLYVSINGSGTSNSEFEFLTGNSLAFLPAGSNAYELYIKDTTPSLVSILAEQGYSRTAFHPYYGAGWNREAVYDYLGFEDFISIEDLEDPEYIRQYVSDEYNYNTIIDMYENKPEGENMFVFNVTMQNHGGYTGTYDNFTEDVSIINPEGQYKKATQYLSIMKESDKAFENFINYFENEEEPTIIVMFGDHQPKVEAEFEEALFGKSLSELTIEETQKRYEVPFVIWANYDIEEQYIERISANYLSTLLLQTANLETTQYNDFLASMYETLPVINAMGYIDANGNYYGHGDESPYTELLNDYKILQYNNMFDQEQKLEDVFSVYQAGFQDPLMDDMGNIYGIE